MIKNKEFLMAEINRLHDSGLTYRIIARKLGIKENLIYSWRMKEKREKNGKTTTCTKN